MSKDKNKKTTKNETSFKEGDQAIQKFIEMEQKAVELENKLSRSLADYSNLEKRIESQRQLFVTLATTAIISKMIDVLDDLYLAQSHLKDPGLQMGIDKFVQVLKSEGLEEIQAEDQEFDPQFMDCVDVVEGKQDQIISVKKKGYLLNGHVVRPAQVAVGKTQTQSNSETQPSS